MSKYIGYDQNDNARRKANNLTDQIGWQSNNNVKSYSSKPGQLSMKAQADRQANKYARLNKKQPVKVLSQMVCPVEKIAYLRKLKIA